MFSIVIVSQAANTSGSQTLPKIEVTLPNKLQSSRKTLCQQSSFPGLSRFFNPHHGSRIQSMWVTVSVTVNLASRRSKSETSGDSREFYRAGTALGDVSHRFKTEHATKWSWDVSWIPGRTRSLGSASWLNHEIPSWDLRSSLPGEMKEAKAGLAPRVILVRFVVSLFFKCWGWFSELDFKHNNTGTNTWVVFETVACC